MNFKLYLGTTKHQPSEPDYYIDVYSCSDEALERIIEFRREAFRKEWFDYENSFYA